MVRALIELDEETNKILNLVKVKLGLNDKSQVIEHIVKKYNEKEGDETSVPLLRYFDDSDKLGLGEDIDFDFSKKLEEIWSGRPYGPYLMSLVVESTIRGLKKELPESKINSGGVCYVNGLHRYFYNKKGYDETIKIISEKAEKSKKWIYDFFEKALEKSLKLKEYSETFNLNNLKDHKNEQLLAYVQTFAKRFYEMYIYGTILILLGYNEENSLYKKINNVLKERVNEKGKKAEYFVDMTKITKIMVPKEQELEVLKLARSAKSKGLYSIFEIKNEFPNELSRLVKKFGWLAFDLLNKPAYDVDYFANLVKEALNFSIGKRISEIENYEKETAKKTDEISKKLNLSKEERETFDLMRDLGYYKWLRQYNFAEACYNLTKVQEEIGKRLGLSLKEVQYILPEEYEDVFNYKEEIKRVVKQRIKNLLILVSDDNKIILRGKKAIENGDRLEFEKRQFDTGANEIRGTVAKSGRVRGVVKIINIKEDMVKMQDRNILISLATIPELLPAMKKAAAIVTNEGGMTCHAAIVARELGIPCVVGTKVATEVLSDGDEIEVDADHGVVKIIEKAK
ncbi:DUF2683 family protein [Candidatus Pacearchaeota archaeon]|nr:DUF2683 family protein [Candidatus Pacearchaeota archaeon]